MNPLCSEVIGSARGRLWMVLVEDDWCPNCLYRLDDKWKCVVCGFDALPIARCMYDIPEGEVE